MIRSIGLLFLSIITLFCSKRGDLHSTDQIRVTFINLPEKHNTFLIKDKRQIDSFVEFFYKVKKLS